MKFFFVVTLLIYLTQSAWARGLEFYFFVNGDNDLITVESDGTVRHQGEKTFLDLVQVGKGLSLKDPLISFHIYYDPIADSSLVKDTSSKMITISHGDLSHEVLFSESSSTDPEILKQLITRRDREDSKRILTFWGHGNGPFAIDSFDYSQPQKKFSVLEFSPLLEEDPFDLIIFDNCSMAYLEVLAHFKHSTSFIMASQFKVPIQGLDYSSLKSLSSETSIQTLYEELMKETMRNQRKVGVFAPFKLYQLEFLDSFIEEFNLVFNQVDWTKSDWHRSLRTRDALDISSWGPSDLRAMAFVIQKQGLVATHKLLENYKKLSYRGYGSLNFFLPENWNDLSSYKQEFFSQTKTANQIANWQLINQ